MDLEFVKFVNHQKHAKSDNNDIWEFNYLGRKREGVSFNDTNPNEIHKPKIKEGEFSLSDFLSKNKNKIIEEPKKLSNSKTNKDSDEESENEENENSYNESEDYSEEKINHYIKSNKKNDIDDLEEAIKEIKERTEHKNKKYDSDSENSENSENLENSENSENSDNEKKEEKSESESENEKHVKNKNKNKKEKSSEKKEKKFDKKNDKKEKKLNEKEKEKKYEKKSNKSDKEKKQKEFKTNLSNTIFIGNLPEDITEKEIKKKFETYGIVKNIRLVQDKKGGKKNFGYVDYETEKAMNSAIESQIKIKNKEIKVEKAKSSFFEGIEHSGGVLENDDKKGRIGKKKQKAIINKAKENMKKMYSNKFYIFENN